MNLKVASIAAGNAYERAGRALDRFQDLPEGDATDEAVSALLDRFFEASEAVWHCKDWLKKHCTEQADREALNSFAGQGILAVVQAIANASKHSGLRDPDKDAPGTIALDLSDAKKRGPSRSLAELYRKLVLRLPDGSAVHPSDFLEDALQQWLHFTQERFGASRWL